MIAVTQRRSRYATLPAPVKGLDLASPLMAGGEGTALRLDNVVCRSEGVAARPGYAEVHDYGAAIRGLYRCGAELVAVTADGIYAEASALHGAGALGTWSGAQLENAAGRHLMLVNGAGAALAYRTGAAMSAAPIEGADLATLFAVTECRRRLYFADSSRKTVWYLPHESIGGALRPIHMDNLFRHSIRIVALAADGERLIVAGDREVAVWQVTDPDTPQGLTLLALTEIPQPVSALALAAGAVMTKKGMLPVAGVATERAGRRVSGSISRPVDLEVGTAELLHDSLSQQALLLQDRDSLGRARQWVLSETGGWSRWTGIEATCWADHDEALYFGRPDGKLCRLDGDSDGAAETPVNCVVVTRPSRCGYNGRKRFTRVRIGGTSHKPFKPYVRLITDLAAGPEIMSGGLLNSGDWEWEDITWGMMPAPWVRPAGAERERWLTAGGMGHEASVAVAVRNAGRLVLTEFDLAYEGGRAL